MRNNYITVYSGLLAALLLLGFSTDGQVFSRGSSSVESTPDVIERIQQFPTDGGLLLLLRERLREEREPEVLQQGMAILALGYMLRDELEVGTGAMQALMRRYPDSPYSRALAPENLGVACSACDGDGRFGRPCAVCSGNRRCQMCAGSGRYQMRMVDGAAATCPQCRGSGLCTACEGSGMSYRQCHACKGRGLVLDRAMIQRAYRFIVMGRPEEFLRRLAVSRGERPAEPVDDDREDDDDALIFF